jgi:hypothetical protein
MAKAELIFVVPWPGTFTMESRGIERSRLGPEPVWIIMIVSVRFPTSWVPVPSRLASFLVRPLRLSEPTKR